MRAITKKLVFKSFPKYTFLKLFFFFKKIKLFLKVQRKIFLVKRPQLEFTASSQYISWVVTCVLMRHNSKMIQKDQVEGILETLGKESCAETWPHLACNPISNH